MSAGTLTMAFVLLTSGQLPTPASAPALADAELAYYKVRGPLRVPITVLPTARPAIRELRLYVSRDRGRSWDWVAKESPDKEFFRFYAPADGEFWLVIVPVTDQGQQPENLLGVRPHVKIVIDTVHRPTLNVTARRDKEELVVAWEAASTPIPPDKQTFVLEYRPLDSLSSVWSRIPAELTPTGEARAPLSSRGPVEVRMQFKDLAGNQASAAASVSGLAGAIPDPHVERVVQSSPNVPNLPNVQLPPPLPVPVPSGAPTPKVPQPLEITPPSGGSPPSFPATAPVAVTNPNPPRPADIGTQLAPAGNTAEPAGHTKEAPPPGLEPPPVASTGPGSPLPAPPGGPPSPGPQDRASAPTQLVNTREVSLEYQLSQVGPSGVGTVKLYITRDGGENWKEFADDPDAKLLVAGKKYQRTLELPEAEGVYGLILVVQNQAKCGKQPPKRGDKPGWLIEVDRTPPDGRFWSPEPDLSRPDAVVIRYESKDKNPAPNPVALEWGPDPIKGPWRPLAVDLPANGTYSWKVPPGTPVKVFLRMRVRDRAGNESVAVARDPQTVDLVPPEGQIVGVQPVHR